MSQLAKLKYDATYTAATYADCALSAAIGTAQGIARAAAFVCDSVGLSAPESLRWEHIRQNSPAYRYRESLRERLDTNPGREYIVSNLVSTVPFVIAGLPAAELAAAVLKEHFPNLPQIAQYTATSATTLVAQLSTAYAAFQASQVVQQPEQYTSADGTLSWKKIAHGYADTTKALLKFDIPFIVAKLAGQSWLLHRHKDPAIASALFDAWGVPLYYLFTVQIGLRNNILHPRTNVHEEPTEAATAAAKSI